MCDPHARLIRLLAAAAGPGSVLARADAAPWRSATFAGERHHIVFVAGGEVAGRLRALRCEALCIPGHLVAQLDVVEEATAQGAGRVAVAALTLESG